MNIVPSSVTAREKIPTEASSPVLNHNMIERQIINKIITENITKVITRLLRLILIMLNQTLPGDSLQQENSIQSRIFL